MRETLPKNEIIRSKILIEKLFKKGISIEEKPIKALYIIEEGEPSGIEVGFSVPKKYFKKANKRNLLRRRLKEAYRKNKKNIIPEIQNKNIQLKIFLLYTSNQDAEYKIIEHKIIVLLQRLTKAI